MTENESALKKHFVARLGYKFTYCGLPTRWRRIVFNIEEATCGNCLQFEIERNRFKRAKKFKPASKDAIYQGEK